MLYSPPSLNGMRRCVSGSEVEVHVFITGSSARLKLTQYSKYLILLHDCSDCRSSTVVVTPKTLHHFMKLMLKYELTWLSARLTLLLNELFLPHLNIRKSCGVSGSAFIIPGKSNKLEVCTHASDELHL